jgi:HEAT repeat protein
MYNKYSVTTLTIIAFFFLMFIGPVCSGEIYKWQDENGNMIFSDTPPDSDVGLSKIPSEPPPSEEPGSAEDTELIYLGPGSTIVRKKNSYQQIDKTLDVYPCENTAEIKTLCNTMLNRNNSFSDRGKAADQLGEIKTHCAAKALTYGLNDQIPVTESAREALRGLGPVAVGPLTDVLEDSAFSEPAQTDAAYLLSQLQTIEPPYMNRLTNLLYNGSSQQQLMAARALWLNSDPALAPVWLSKLTDSNKEIVEKAASALARLKDKNTLPKLMAAMNNLSDNSLLVPLFKALVAIDPEYALDAVSSNFYEKPPFFRKTAISALGMAETKSAFPIFFQSLKDENEMVKNAAIYAIGHFESPQAIERLIDLLGDSSDDIASAAAKQLKSYGLLAGAQLIKALEHFDGTVRKRSAPLILENLNSFEDYQPKKTLISPVETVVDKTALQQALTRSYEMKNLPVIAGTLGYYLERHTSPEYREVVTQALEQYGDVGMVTTLYCLHDDPVLKNAAAYWYRKNIQNVDIQCITVPQ